MPLPQAGTVVRGAVERLERYGAFVALEPKHVYRGLLHISQISDRRVPSVEDALSVGDEVNVRVLEVDPRRGRISLSMRGVPQPWEEALQAAAAEQSEEDGAEVREDRPATLQELAARFGREPAPPKPAPAARTDRGAREKEQLAAILRRMRGQ